MKLIAIIFSLLLSVSVYANQSKLIVDAIVASVNGKPITLHQVCQRLNPVRQLSFKEASKDSEFRFVLDSVIQELLLEEEAETRRLSISDQEIEAYLTEISKRNSLSREEFELAIAEEEGSFDNYKNKIKNDILKSKLASSLLQDGIAVSDEEIQQYLSSSQVISKQGNKIKLRRIQILKNGRYANEAKDTVNKIYNQLDEGSNFQSLAKKYSESFDAEDGGLIGILAEKDLNPELFDTVFSLSKSQYSDPIETKNAYSIYYVEDRYEDSNDNQQALVDEIRKSLQKQKLDEKIQTYFSTELYNKYAVDKKI